MIDSEFHPAGPYVIHSASGTIDVDHLLVATRDWFGHEDFDPATAVVWDLRAAYLNLSLEELSKMYASVRRVVDAKRTGGRTAWVHESAIITAFIDIVGEAFDWGSQWHCFSTVNEAVAWCLEADR